MILTNRLLACANFVRPDCTVTDVGTDHGMLACYLATKGHQVIAADVNQKPLAMAKSTILKYNLASNVRTCLSDGLQAIDPNDAQDVIMAGMGGELIFSLILACPYLRSDRHHLILQPMTQTDYLRQSLAGAGFAILDETALEENRHHYTILSVQYDGNPHTLTDLQAIAGAHLSKEDATSIAYLNHQDSRLTRRIEGLQKAQNGGDELAKLQALRTELRRYL